MFAYSTERFYATWNTSNKTPSVLTSSDYYRNYRDVIDRIGYNFFLGLKLNSSNQIEKAYSCGLYNDRIPFCIEGYFDGTKYENNKTILQNASLWNNTCTISTEDEGTAYEYELTCCNPPTSSQVYAEIGKDFVETGVELDNCSVDISGYINCTDGVI